MLTKVHFFFKYRACLGTKFHQYRFGSGKNKKRQSFFTWLPLLGDVISVAITQYTCPSSFKSSSFSFLRSNARHA